MKKISAQPAPPGLQPDLQANIQLRKGRGALSNLGSRFLARHSEYEPGEAPAVGKASEFFPDQTRRLITRNTSPDVPFDRSINAYKGCEHGCVYCFARPTHAYLDLSPGIDFETKIFYKTGVVERLRAELGARLYTVATIALGTNTDPYQPVEKRLRITRQILETLLEYRHPVSIVTKGALAERDLDLLAELASSGLVSVMVSVTTLDNKLKTALEPRAASGAQRLRLVAKLAEAGVPVGVLLAPVIPWINDAEIETIVASAAAAGAGNIGYLLLRLPGEVAELFTQWLQQHYPQRAEHVLNLVRDTRSGALYRARWGERMRGRGPIAELINQRFNRARSRHGLDVERGALRTDLFRVPTAQGSLF
jgi:DNA repair photolyase